MFMACRHIKTNGLRCESPALRGHQFCYYHSKTHSIGTEPSHTRFLPLQLPAPEDPAAIQLSVALINNAILTGRIDLKKATTLFMGLRIAAHFIDRRQFFDADEIVQSAEEGADGAELAPLDYICDDDEDCNDCPHSELCPNCIHPGEGDQDANDSEEDDENEEAEVEEEDEDQDEEDDEEEEVLEEEDEEEEEEVVEKEEDEEEEEEAEDRDDDV
jgi:cobalamin biosynthesis protein CobT